MAKVSLRAYNREIETMIDRGQLDEAIAHCHHIFKTFPKHLETYRLLGKAYLEYKRYGEAVDIFTRVLVAAPSDFVANVGMSIIRDEENKLDDAIWHMERAYEFQPSNSAINAELQRLYGRRDGVTPPRIRMTRGALAQMYMHGELYPQAISEIKSVLKEDAGRSDMQSLLARAHYRSGQKNEAAEVASSLLRRYPYCLDANRVLAEILGAERPENAKVYRDRVVEIDPYAALVNGTLFQSNEVPDQAVTIEHLDWNGQPVGASVQEDWRETRAISTGSLGSAREEQPDWLRNTGKGDVPTVHPTPKADSSFDFSATPAQPTPQDEIPDFLRQAGWGQSTGTFDESKSAFAEEGPASGAGSLAQGDLPDWVKAMAPKQETQPPAEEDMPDWINNIMPGSVAAASAAAAQTDDDWLNQLAQPSQSTSQPADEQPDWMKGLESSTPSVSTDQPDWLKGPGSETPGQASDNLDWLNELGNEPQTSAPSLDQPDWLSGLGGETEPQVSAPSSGQPDWLSGLGEETPAQPSAEPDWMSRLSSEPQASAPVSDELDWLKGLGEEKPSTQPSAEPDWMSGLGSEPQASTPASEELDWLKGLGEETPSAQPSAEPDWMQDLGSETPATSASEQPDWLKGLGEETSPAPQSAEPDWLQGLGEETPASTPAEESDWLKKFDVQQQSESKPEVTDFSFLDELTAEPAQPAAPETPAPSMATPSTLGTSQQEIDDSLAWLESLAAKQGATEGLLTKPEERLEHEPEWVKQAKGISTPPAAQQPPAEPVTAPPTPPAKVEDLGKSQQEIDDSLAWLESLAAKQGATEGLLTKPEERREQEPEWVKQAKGVSQPPVEQAPVSEPAPTPSIPAAKPEDLGKSQQEIDDSLAWLEALAAKQGATEGLLTKPEERTESEPEWVRQAKSTPQKPVEPEPAPQAPAPKVEDLGKSQQEIDDSLAWLEGLAAKQGATEGLLTKPEERLDKEPEWIQQAKNAPQTPVQPVEEPVEEIPSEPVPTADDTTAWLRSLDEEETQTKATISSADETAIWLKSLDEEKPSVTEETTSRVDETAMWLKSLEEEKPLTETERTSDVDETSMWLKSLDEPESQPEPAEPAQEDLPAWMQAIEEEKPVAEEPAVSSVKVEETAPVESIEEPDAQQETPKAEEEALPSWLSDLEKEEAEGGVSLPASQDDLPDWLRDETGEMVAEPTRIEPTRPTDWRPSDPKREEIPVPPPVGEVQPEPEPEPKPEPKPVKKAPAKTEVRPAAPPEPYREPITRTRGTGMLSMPIDPILHTARTELSRSNIPSALETYGKLIKKGRFLDEVIFDLREALYRYPVEVSIWQSLGDAYMRANRLQDALDAYTKAEELLR